MFNNSGRMNSQQGMGPGGNFGRGGLHRRPSLGASLPPIDAAISDILGGRRPSMGNIMGNNMGNGMGSSMGMSFDGGMDTMGRRDSLETASMIDACILDLTRRRQLMANMGMSSQFPDGRSNGMGFRGNPVSGHNSLGLGGRGPANMPPSMAMRQQELQQQQFEIEQRRQELELQRQQLIAGLQDTSIAMGGIPFSLDNSSNEQRQQELENQRQQLIAGLQDTSVAMGGIPSSLDYNSMPIMPYDDIYNRMPSMPQNMPNDDTGMNFAGAAAHPSQQWWVCQLCNSKAFASREEAMQHESLCIGSNTSSVGSRGQSGMSQSAVSAEMQAVHDSLIDPDTYAHLPIPLPLAMPMDKEWLTPLHCFVRRHCVDLFSASHDDVATPSKGKRKPIQVGQVGIRCPHCIAPPDAVGQRERGSVYYPTTISSIYNATMNLLQRHLHSCPSVPDAIMEQYQTLKGDDARSGTSKKYWVESARSLGLVDTPLGIRFSSRTPPPLPRLSHQQHSTARNKNNVFSSFAVQTKTDDDNADKAADDNDTSAPTSEHKDETPLGPLVAPEDKPYATAFSYKLLSQMQPCVFTEADRLGKRKGLPAGFAGLACRHCFGGYGSGRFFPSSIKTLSDTSKTLNVLHNHMMRCRKCPQEVRDSLEKLRVHHDDERAKMKFGSQKAFFARIWARLHGGSPRSTSTMKRKMSSLQAYPPDVQRNQFFNQHFKQNPQMGQQQMPLMQQMGMLGGLDVLSMQAASAASEGSPTKRHKAN